MPIRCVRAGGVHNGARGPILSTGVSPPFDDNPLEEVV